MTNPNDSCWKSGSARVAESIGSAIVNGTYPVGEKLPLEADLARQHGASRNTLREAMRLLAAKNLIEIAPRRGTVVRPRGAWNILDRDVLAWSASQFRNDPSFMEELVRIRFAIEPAAAQEAARNATDAEIAVIRSTFEDMARLVDQQDEPDCLEADLAFHVAVAEATHNRFLKSVAYSIVHAMRLNFQRLFEVPHNFAGNLENHRLVMDAIAMRDPKEAFDASLRLLERSHDDTRRLFESPPKREETNLFNMENEEIDP
ncbi:FadR/GntR family transcriptional regulator [Sedimentitalea nanhaiensis]|uniref:Transcriptional regulator, GntR family n=1 Tax=Sedimentitalea nanhaiensis TaxID=999627 RepID=A0A1I7BFY8_9RHOB|nr:FadR/GntR family transcriptional regulator [Sedimentitalea nanhaiensis]SFT86116.1 transcriptional regulator, GntR family [Sedimentitalea nanhaiensis]